LTALQDLGVVPGRHTMADAVESVIYELPTGDR
jgi:hypothetical protein